MRKSRLGISLVASAAVGLSMSGCSTAPGPEELRGMGFDEIGELDGSGLWLQGDLERVNMRMTGEHAGYCNVSTLEVRTGVPLCSTSTEDQDRILVFVAPADATDAFMTDTTRGTRVPAVVIPTSIPGVPAVAAAVTPAQEFRSVDSIDYTTADGKHLDRYGQPIQAR
jgi:hypothetical protein